MRALWAVSGLAGPCRVWSYTIGSASPSRSGGFCWWPWWTHPFHTFGSRPPTLWSARCSSGWSPNRQIWPFPPDDRLRRPCGQTDGQSSSLLQPGTFIVVLKTLSISYCYISDSGDRNDRSCDHPRVAFRDIYKCKSYNSCDYFMCAW